MKHIIIGTAGHVDHGKTCLTRALTGVDTDRLKEEQKRGITIEIGFAQLTLPNGQTASIIDVPGHEKFIRNMLVGAAGMDVVLMVIAADEGFMPQSREHLGILSLLGVQNGIIVVTKADMVDEEWLEAIQEEARETVQEMCIRDRSTPVLGRICMDMCMARVPEGESVQRGDEVIVWGADTWTAEDAAAAAGTISYEVVCSISRRVPRFYRG